MTTGASAFPHAWRAEILDRPPLIAPARSFVYPRDVAGEADALARGALQLMVHPGSGGARGGTVAFLATCARGFADPRMPSGLFSCPNPHHLCAVAGGYAYIVDTAAPETCVQIPLRPVVEIRALTDAALLIFIGFHSIVAWGREGLAWQTARLSSEGIRLIEVNKATLRGFGWDLQSDKEVEFTLDLRTGTHELRTDAHTGGAAPSR
jgi:hypothetical protein